MSRKTIPASMIVGVVMAVLAMQGGALAASKTKSHVVRVTASGGHVDGTQIKGQSAKGAPFGTCTIDVSYSPPKVHQVWKCTGGSFQGDYTLTTSGDTASGNPVLSHGTGKFKHISGTLHLVASLSKNSATITGRARY